MNPLLHEGISKVNHSAHKSDPELNKIYEFKFERKFII